MKRGASSRDWVERSDSDTEPKQQRPWAERGDGAGNDSSEAWWDVESDDDGGGCPPRADKGGG